MTSLHQRNVFEEALLLVPGFSQTEAKVALKSDSTMACLVDLIDRKGSHCRLQRDLSSLQDHAVVRPIVDAAAMRDTKQGLDQATGTLKVRKGLRELYHIAPKFLQRS